MDDQNPYQSPQSAPDSPKRPALDPLYRLRQFAIMVGPEFILAVVGFVLGPALVSRPAESIGAGVGGLVGLLIGIVLRISSRKKS